jgi:DNA-binding NarL/FixJ family response regulator
MNDKISILIADDIALDRRNLRHSLLRLAPDQFYISEHSQGATLLDRLLQAPPQMLVLDRAFTDQQTVMTSDCQEAISLAHRIRNDYSKVLNNMAILIYSRWTASDEAAEFSNTYQSKGIWSRSKDVDHQLLVDHIRHILTLWPPANPWIKI